MNGKIHRLWCLILDSDGISGSFFVGSVNMCFIFADVIIVYRVFNEGLIGVNGVRNLTLSHN